MRKSEMVRTIADETSLTQVKAEEVIEAILDEIKVTLSEGETVILRRFGSFAVRAKNAREGRNPKTGEPANIATRRVVRFKPGKTFKAAVDQAPSLNYQGTRRHRGTLCPKYVFYRRISEEAEACDSYEKWLVDPPVQRETCDHFISR